MVGGVHRVDGTRTGNVYLILGERVAVVDTGMPGDGQKILRYLANLNRKPSEVSHIILTHYHMDHCGGLGVLKSETGAQVVAHELEADYIAGRKPIPQENLLLKLGGWIFRSQHANVDRTVHDWDVIEELGLRVIPTMGHTPGSISLFLEQRKVMFTGDALSYSGGLLLPPARKWSLNIDDAWASVRRLSQFDFDVLLGGHGEPLIGGASARVKEWIGAMKT